MARWRTLAILSVLLLLPSSAHSAPPDAPEENLPIAPRPLLSSDTDCPLNLDAAVNRLIAFNSDLRAKYQDISEARADELTASLRNAPAIFFSGHQLPYGSYSPQRPGTPNYEISPVANVDFSGKRRSHMREARLATRETEARFQNAVRVEIDRLYDTYVDVLETHERVGAARADLQKLAELATKIREGRRVDADQLSLQEFNARAACQEAEVELEQRKRRLALQLAIPPEKAIGLEIRGALEDRSPPPPPVEELIQVALRSRPDLTAQRLGSEHDRAILQVTQAERVDDAAVFYSPFEIQNNAPQGKQSSSGWGGGALFALPLLDRNQGVIARAKANVRQGQIEVEGLERMVVNEVRRVWTEYTASREVVRQYEQEGLPAAQRVFEEDLRHYLDGNEGIGSVLEALRDYREMGCLYRETLVRHRRSMLKINTAVGQRVLP